MVMTARDVLARAAALGVRLVARDGKVGLFGPQEAIAALRPAVLRHKPELLAMLTANDAESGRRERWRVIYRDGRKIEVWTSPPANRAEMLASRPDAVDAEPIEERQAPEPPAFEPRLAPTLERRIRAMAERWQYSPDELNEVLRRAARSPDAWLAVVTADESLARGKGRGVLS